MTRLSRSDATKLTRQLRHGRPNAAAAVSLARGDALLAAMRSDRTSDDGALPRELVKLIAMDIGKEMVAYIEVMYPDVWAAGNSGFRLSVRNHIHNDIMAAIKLHDEAAIMKWLADRKAHRREWLAQWRKIRSRRNGK